MKLARLISRTSSILSQSPFQNATYSTATLELKGKAREQTLYRRISKVGEPNKSVEPILDQWIQEGRPVTQNELRGFIRELRHYHRFKHALEISQWMSDKRYWYLLAGDVAVRLDLIAKVHGIELAENFFFNTPKQLKTVQVYSALLNCYAHAKCVDKAEAVMQKMREFGFALRTINYNILLNLYCQTENHEKIVALTHEMEKKQINFDKFTYSILLNTIGADSDVDGIEKIVTRMESDEMLNVDWSLYAAVANRFLKGNFIDKALESLRKSEQLVSLEKKKNEGFSYLITLYASAGKKEEVLRVWDKCKKFKVCNKDYMSILSSILKFDDIETAEKVYNEWIASDPLIDTRIPNFLISYYCKKAHVEKAEALIESLKMKNSEISLASTWLWLSMGYCQSNQMLKAVEAMETGLLGYTLGPRILNKETLEACLKYLKEEGDTDRAGAFVRLLKEKGIISEGIQH